MHLLKKPARIERRLPHRKVLSLSRIRISQPAEPIQAPKQIDRFDAESALAVVQHLGAGAGPGGKRTGCLFRILTFRRRVNGPFSVWQKSCHQLQPLEYHLRVPTGWNHVPSQP